MGCWHCVNLKVVGFRAGEFLNSLCFDSCARSGSGQIGGRNNVCSAHTNEIRLVPEYTGSPCIVRCTLVRRTLDRCSRHVSTSTTLQNTSQARVLSCVAGRQKSSVRKPQQFILFMFLSTTWSFGPLARKISFGASIQLPVPMR